MNGGIAGFRPRFVPTLITIPVVLVCLGLGLWQIQRLHWKEALIARREAALAAAPIAAPRRRDEALALEFHRITAEGVFLHDREILRIAPGPTGGSGFEIMTPLREPDGRVIFVDRGFVPTALKDRPKRAAGDPAGVVRVIGLLRMPPARKPSWFLPDNKPDRNLWFWVDLPAMASADGLGEVAPFYIEADATPNPGGWPKGRGTLEPLPNDHLQYAITWFALAATALAVFFLSQRRTGDPLG